MRFIPAVSAVQIRSPLPNQTLLFRAIAKKEWMVGHNGPMVKRLRHRPFTAITRVRVPVGSYYGSLAQLGEHLPYKQGVIGSSPIVPTITCGNGSVVERRLAKANVASSNLVFRSKNWRHSQEVRQRPAKPLPPVRFWVAPPQEFCWPGSTVG